MDESLRNSGEGAVSMFCPTCRAEQSWSNECRRCKCDLSELHAVWRAAHQERVACLRALAAVDFDRALNHARRYRGLQSGEDASRLLTVCHLLRGDWPAACQAATGEPPQKEQNSADAAAPWTRH